MLSDPQIRPLLVKNVLLGLGQPVQGGSPSTAASQVTRGTFGDGEQGDRDYTFSANREGITPLTVQGVASPLAALQNWKRGETVVATVDHEGKLGVGTTGCLSALTVEKSGTTVSNVGNVDALGSTLNHFQIQDSADPTKRLVVGILTDANNNAGAPYLQAVHAGVDRTDLLLNPNGGNLGIGTTGPGVKLHVKASDGTNDLIYGLKLQNDGASDDAGPVATGMLFSVSASADARGKGGLVYAYPSGGGSWNRGNFYFLQNIAGDSTVAGLADAVMTIQNNGNVGIGTTAPQVALDIGNNADKSLRVHGSWNGLDRWTYLSNSVGIGYLGVFAAGPLKIQPDSGSGNTVLNEYSGNVGIGGFPGSTSKLYVNGNVGIGTPEPQGKLHVYNYAGNPDGIGGSIILNRYLSGDSWRGGAIFSTYPSAAGQDALAFAVSDSTTPLAQDRVKLVILNNGNVGIGTTAPAEKLDVVGKIRASGDHPIVIDPSTGGIKSDGLNQIVFLRPLEPAGDDGEAIDDAIKKLPANGGIIMLTPGTYNIHTTVSVKKSGVKIRGYGGMWPDDEGPGPVTTLLWSETTGGTIVELNSDAEDTAIWDLELSDLTLDGNNHATKGLVLDKVSSSKFRSVHVRSINGTAFELTATDAEPNVGNSWNLFENCSAFDIAKGVVLSGNLLPNAAANSCHNTFIGLTVQYNGTANDDAGVWLRFCDNNSFYRCWILHASNERPVKGAGVVVDDPDSASGNYFYHLQAGAGGFRIDNADASPYSKNVVFGYDQGNKQPAPVSSPDTDVQKFLSWIDSNGAIFGSQELAITGRQFKASGKVSTNAYTVTGHDEGDDKTWFCSEIKVGDKITIEGETRTVAAIASDISLTVDSAFSAYTDKEMTVSPPLLRIADSSGSTKLLVSDTGDASVYGNLATSASVSVAGALSASGNLSVAGSLSVGAVPQLSTGHQETGFCSAGGLAAVPTEAGAAWETECPVNFKTVLSQGPSYITITATGVGSVAAVAIRRANGSVDPNDIWYGPTGGGSHTFTGPFNRYGFSLLVASIDDLDQGEPYYFQGTYVTIGN